MSTTRDYYEILQVSPNADTEVIQVAYRRLAKKWHPDHNPGDPVAAERMREINEAFRFLSNPSFRRVYDGHPQNAPSETHKPAEPTSPTGSPPAPPPAPRWTRGGIISFVAGLLIVMWVTASLVFSSRLPAPNSSSPDDNESLDSISKAAFPESAKHPDPFAGLLIPVVETPVGPRELTPAELFDRVSPAVVMVVALDRQGRPLSSGTGFLVKKNGQVATNYHVIGKADSTNVVLPDGKKLVVAGVLAWDEDGDLAVLRVPYEFGAEPLKLAGSTPPRIGTRVYAIGNPHRLSNTLSDGLVSGHRVENGQAWVQTTAAISPGSSGGPLLDEAGRVVGVTTMFEEGGQNLNFAAPASRLAQLLDRADAVTTTTKFPLSAEREVRAIVRSGNAWLKRSEFEKALAEFEKAVRLDPENAGAYAGRAKARFGLRFLDSARTDFTKAIRVDATVPDYYEGRGLVWMEFGRYAEAVRDFTSAIELDPSQAHFYALRGRCHSKLGQLTKAKQDLAEASRLDPDNY